MRIGSLCSGYGGLDLAALEVFPGSTVEWHCEYDAAPSKILAHHWPDVPNYHDITEIDFGAMPPVDLLTAGYPCQPFSPAGRRRGTNDERHLWPWVRAAIRYVRPRFTLLENVAGHRSLGFDRVLGDLAEDGLDVWWTSVRASDVGACHKRERLFILVADPDRYPVREQPVAEPWRSGAPVDRRDSAASADAASGGREGFDDGARGAGGSSVGWVNKAGNSLATCLDCHAYVESHRADATEKGWLVSLHTEHPSAYVPLLYRNRLVLLDDMGGVGDCEVPW